MINASDSNGTFYILNQNQWITIIFIHGVCLNHKIWKHQFDVFKNKIVKYLLFIYSLSISELNDKKKNVIKKNEEKISHGDEMYLQILRLFIFIF